MTGRQSNGGHFLAEGRRGDLRRHKKDGGGGGEEGGGNAFCLTQSESARLKEKDKHECRQQPIV